ncbi:MAG: polysaccharide biosynthesis tyrosine autokinase [Candidatus Marinimicrobia bacterium]|nr:polysaccharide biosynthesis tyrosine autokinase [Candidatus Neomarinimicrobiota bacterium]
MENTHENMNRNVAQGFSLREENELNLRYLVQVIMQRIHVVIILFLVIFIGTILYTINQSRVYKSETKILIESGVAAGGIFEQMTPFINNAMKINNEIQIITSRTISERTINSLMILYPLDSLYLFDRGLLQENQSFTTKFRKQLKKMFTREEEKILTLDEKRKNYINRLLDKLEVSPVRETQTITIALESYDPDEAAIILNELVTQYYSNDLERVSNSAGKVRAFLEAQINDVEPKLSAIEQQLSEFLESEGVIDLDENAKQLIQRSSEFEAQLFTARAELTITNEQLLFLKEQLSEKQRQILDNRLQVANPFILALREEIALSEKSLIGSDEKSVNVQIKRKEIEVLRKRLEEETVRLVNAGYLPGDTDPMRVNQLILDQIVALESQKVSLETKVSEYGKLNDYYKNLIESIPSTSISYIRLERERQTHERIYLLMKERYEEARIQEASQISNVYVIDKAEPNYKPIKPKTNLNILLGFIFGLAAGIGVILLREFMDNSIRSKEDLEKLGLTVLGIIPSMSIDRAKKVLDKKYSSNDDFRNRLISHFKPRSPISESFRSLRTNLELSVPADKPLTSLVVTSAGAAEGKSTVIANLAIAYAQFGMKVLLVDGDMRKPTIHKMFSTPKKPGLANMITKRSKLDESIFKTEIDNLYVMPAGSLPPNPSELLGSKSMKELFTQLKKQFDKIFFDAPPLMAVTDAALIGAQTDGILLVARAGEAQKEVVVHLQQEMKNTKIQIAGTVLNDVNPKNTSSGYYYYYQRYYFDKYYGENTK